MNKQKKIKEIIVVVALLVISIFSIINGIGAHNSDEYYIQGNVYVSPDQPSVWYDATHVHTVAEGIANASSGDTIYVWSGIYYNETVTIDKPLDIIGNATSSILNGSKLIPGGTAISIESDNVSIKNIQIFYYNLEAIYIASPASYINISYCYIYNCCSGICYEGSPDSYDTSLEIYNNTLEKVEDAGNEFIYLEGKIQYINITKNIFNNSLCSGIYLDSNILYVNLSENRITNVSNEAAIMFIGNIENSTITKNNISYNEIGISCGTYVNNTKIYNNSFYGNNNYAIELASGLSATNTSIYHNNFYNNSYESPSHHQGYDYAGPSNYNQWNTSNTPPPVNCGNFWDDFYKPSQGAYDRNLDGIIDSPYIINGSSSQYDFLPLASPWNGIYPTQQESHIDLLNLTDLSSITGNYGITWEYTYNTSGPPVWCNSSGIENETIDIDLTINNTVNCSAVNVWVGDLYNSSRNLWVNASNITMYISPDNTTWFLVEDNVGNGNGVFLDGGCNLTIDNTTWGDNSGNPWLYHGNGEYINESCNIYLRFKLVVPVPPFSGDERYNNYTRFTNVSAWTIYANGSGPFDSETFSGVLDTLTDFYRKPGYTNCTWGVPDFSQKQVNGTTFQWNCTDPTGTTEQWYMDGPTALCNCLWWLDCKNNPTGNTSKYWMPDFYGNGSKDKNNVALTIEWISTMMNTTVGTGTPTKRGTTAENFTQGIYNIFEYLGINNSYKVVVDGYRSNCSIQNSLLYENITKELDACHDVILLLGFWYEDAQSHWHRVGGHYVQCNGYSRIEQELSFSDPYYDNAADRGDGWASHFLPYDASSQNNTDNVSYDYYFIYNDPEIQGGILDIDGYPISPPDANAWSYMNWWDNCSWTEPSGGDWLCAEIEMAWYISNETYSINVTKESNITKISDTSKNTTVVFNITVCNNGTATITDVTVNDTLPACCEYIDSSLPIENVSGNYTFNVTDSLDPSECITFNITVNFTADCGVPNGTILNNVVYAFSNEGVNATDSFGIQYGDNTAPVINWQYPTNNSIDIPLVLANISIIVSDNNSDSMNVYFYTNKSNDTWYSEWNGIGENISVFNGIYYCNQTFNISKTDGTRWRWGNTTYYWYVNVTDGKTWTNASYSFTTAGSRYDINTDNTVNVVDLSYDWSRRTIAGYSSYYGLFDVNADDVVNVIDLSSIWANKS